MSPRRSRGRDTTTRKNTKTAWHGTVVNSAVWTDSVPTDRVSRSIVIPGRVVPVSTTSLLRCFEKRQAANVTVSSWTTTSSAPVRPYGLTRNKSRAAVQTTIPANNCRDNNHGGHSRRTGPHIGPEWHWAGLSIMWQMDHHHHRGPVLGTNAIDTPSARPGRS
jgi:hypothetical protein